MSQGQGDRLAARLWSATQLRRCIVTEPASLRVAASRGDLAVMGGLIHGFGSAAGSNAGQVIESGCWRVQVTTPDDGDYDARVDALLSTAKPEINLLDAARNAKGMFPAELQRRFRERGIVLSQSTGRINYKPPTYSPELHALDGEWYFTESTSAELGRLVGTGRVCLLGTPTVAASLDASSFTLIDRSPFIRDRFNFHEAGAKIVTSNVEDTDIDSGFDVVLFDPPWYVPQLLQWFSLAARAVSPQGKIMFPLLGELTRPTAQQEREALLTLAAAVGEVEVFPSAIEYDIPLFEQQALAASGIQLDGPWRRADLVAVRVRSLIAAPKITFSSQKDTDQWSTFVLGSQVVKLRVNCVLNYNEKMIHHIEGVSDYLYDSVSRRDPHRNAIDLWTSRNRVAQVGDRAAVETVLSALQGDPNGLPERVKALRAAQGAIADELLRILEV